MEKRDFSIQNPVPVIHPDPRQVAFLAGRRPSLLFVTWRDMSPPPLLPCKPPTTAGGKKFQRERTKVCGGGGDMKTENMGRNEKRLVETPPMEDLTADGGWNLLTGWLTATQKKERKIYAFRIITHNFVGQKCLFVAHSLSAAGSQSQPCSLA